jgi:hypothetical protein
VPDELPLHRSPVRPRLDDPHTVTERCPDPLAEIDAAETGCGHIGLGPLPPVINRAHLPLDVVLDPHRHVAIDATALRPDLSL